MSSTSQRFLLQCSNSCGNILLGGEILNNRIKELRKALGLNQAQFAEKLGLKQVTVSGYELGTRQPNEAVLLNICRSYRVNPDWLRLGEGEMFLDLPDVVFEDIAQMYDLSPEDIAAIRVFASLPPEDRAAILRFAKQLASAT